MQNIASLDMVLPLGGLAFLPARITLNALERDTPARFRKALWDVLISPMRTIA